MIFYAVLPENQEGFFIVYVGIDHPVYIQNHAGIILHCDDIEIGHLHFLDIYRLISLDVEKMVGIPVLNLFQFGNIEDSIVFIRIKSRRSPRADGIPLAKLQFIEICRAVVITVINKESNMI